MWTKATKIESVNVLESHRRNVEQALSRSLRAHWMLHLIEGIALVVVGAVVFAIPPLGMFGLSCLLGWSLLIGGGIALVAAISRERAPDLCCSLLWPTLCLLSGLMVLLMPMEGAFLLTVVLIVFFIAQGVASLTFAVERGFALSGKWGWILVSGVADLMMAMLIFIHLPGETAWTIGGLLIGINIVIDGVVLIGMSLRARNAAA